MAAIYTRIQEQKNLILDGLDGVMALANLKAELVDARAMKGVGTMAQNIYVMALAKAVEELSEKLEN